MTRTPATWSSRLLTLAALLTMTVAIAAAQTGSTTLSGTVFDSSGAPVVGATVLLTKRRTQARFEVTSDSAGRFEFVPLPSDDYTLEARFPAFKITREQVRLATERVPQDRTLPLGSLQETVTVAAAQTGGLTDGRLPAKGRPLDFQKLRLDLSVSANAAQTVHEVGNRDDFERAVTSCEPSPLGGRVRPPRRIKEVRPAYPASAQDAGIAGKVVMQAIIGTDGTVREVQVKESAHPDLATAAVDAVKQWQFDGTLLNCVPVEVGMTVTVNFEKR